MATCTIPKVSPLAYVPSVEIRFRLHDARAFNQLVGVHLEGLAVILQYFPRVTANDIRLSVIIPVWFSIVSLKFKMNGISP